MKYFSGFPARALESDVILKVLSTAVQSVRNNGHKCHFQAVAEGRSPQSKTLLSTLLVLHAFAAFLIHINLTKVLLVVRLF